MTGSVGTGSVTAGTVKVLVPSGVLGLGFDRAALARGVAAQPDIIAIDGGSTDSGPFYLGTATSKYARAACKAEWLQLMQARHQAGVPLVIGSAGTCGADAMVQWMLDITEEILGEKGHTNMDGGTHASPGGTAADSTGAVAGADGLRVALVFSEQTPATVIDAMDAGRLQALPPTQPLSVEVISSCQHVVALAGAEVIQAALATGADIVIAGRTTDTALIAAMPLARGLAAGAAWHGAKIAECGALCSTRPGSGVIMVSFDQLGFEVWPLAEGVACTPQSVAAHMLYENSDPLRLHEPGGHLDVRHAHYEAVSPERVRVTGSTWVPAGEHRVKLEGARCAGYQTTLLALLREPRYVTNAVAWRDRLQQFLEQDIHAKLSLEAVDYTLEIRLIGVDAVLGPLENVASEPHEVGVLVLITASTAELAEEMGKLVNPHLLHYPLSDDEPMPTFAFPYSPAQSERGACYEFCLQHTMALADPLQAFTIETVQCPAP